MCQFSFCGSFPEFEMVKGPIGRPPESGWKITSLPPGSESLTQSWAAHPGKPDNARAAWYELLEFLTLNGHASKEITEWVWAEGPRQWCASDPGRCPRKWKNAASQPSVSRFFPWAQTVWENFNNALHDDVADIPTALAVNVGVLTTFIEMPPPTGCEHCATHWRQILADRPVPESPTLQEAREWLVDVHNLTREGKTPVPFEEIADKFHWTTP